MNQKDDFLKKALGLLKQESMPTKQQKDIMLDRILMECKRENVSGFGRLKKMVIIYPWRVAFTVSAVQAAVFTIIFGTRYTNLFLGFFGG
jgi:hypothetical protein